MNIPPKLILIILDGWGMGDGSTSDAIKQAKTPFIKNLYKTAAQASLITSGMDVG